MTIWVDEREPDPAWTPPAGVEPAPVVPRRRRPHPVLIGVVVLALVFGLVWALGGFNKRTDLRINRAPGELIETGPYEFTFTKATAQRKNRFGSKWIVEIYVYGEGRTTGDEAITPSTLSPMFVAGDEKTKVFEEMDGQRFGEGATFGRGSSFTPGLAPVQYTVTFEFEDGFRPEQVISFAVAELEYSDTSLLGTGEKIWNNADHQYVLRLPLTWLPEQK